MTKKRNTYYILIGVLTAILIGVIVTAFVIPEEIAGTHLFLGLTMAAFIILAGSIATIVVFTISQHLTLNNLKKENIYSIHRSSHFYNLALFDRCLFRRRRHLLKNEGYMISLSPIKQGSYSFSSNHHMIADFYGFISDYLFDYLTNSHIFKYKDVSYCFNHSIFLIYIVGNKEQVENVVSTIENEIYEIAKREDIRLFVQPSFGICKSDERSTAYKLVNRANHARKVAEANFETMTYFDKDTMLKKAEVDPAEIMAAIKNDEFVVYYQPKYHLASRRFVSLEALVRWDSPKYGLLSPFQFISSLESGGLIHQIDMYVFEKVCENLLNTKKRGRRALPVSVNFSLYEFYSPGFVDDVLNMLTKYNVNPALLEIEITETTGSANSFLAISILKKFKDVGLKILMDDFGVGYATLSTLKKLPIDVVKIDKSFIDDIVLDLRSREVVKFLIAFCKANNLEVVAEGVEDAQQVAILRKCKCDMIQGYYYSKPLPIKELDKFLSSNEFERKEYL